MQGGYVGPVGNSTWVASGQDSDYEASKYWAGMTRNWDWVWILTL